SPLSCSRDQPRAEAPCCHRHRKCDAGVQGRPDSRGRCSRRRGEGVLVRRVRPTAVDVIGWDSIVDWTLSESNALAVDRFLFARHGETQCTLAKIYQAEDEPLNATGSAQAVRLAEALASANVGTIVASSMTRAAQTASIVGNALGIVVIFSPDLRERILT